VYLPETHQQQQTRQAEGAATAPTAILYWSPLLQLAINGTAADTRSCVFVRASIATINQPVAASAAKASPAQSHLDSHPLPPDPAAAPAFMVGQESFVNFTCDWLLLTQAHSPHHQHDGIRVCILSTRCSAPAPSAPRATAVIRDPCCDSLRLGDNPLCCPAAVWFACRVYRQSGDITFCCSAALLFRRQRLQRVRKC
jgi:hypothetical protein